ncbi:DNA glycosylase [Pseudomassariella vexata]|uniref:Adenine DNA glycosylase n=1 Tax=Pseudomassariella vexata TaxID=1141098 RepID=A0A1Y2E0Z2_9PEZI|nr:DNA glycosylase [Pseudomassariella vexata]ORY65221.1 DNA glycosylase [Pseudomassariella vexata]
MTRSSRNAQQPSSPAPNSMANVLSSSTKDNEIKTSRPARKKVVRKRTRSDASDSDFNQENEAAVAVPITKKRKTTRSAKEAAKFNDRIFGANWIEDPILAACDPPARRHGLDYHRPLLLDSRHGRGSLINWFDSVSTARSMPWRKEWIDPRLIADASLLRSRLERRAYEVWISEIMLQQTRVAVVIDYWNRWMAKWPTIQDLAAAEPDDVLAAWRGLGYYSRATRIHEAAKLVCENHKWKGLLPAAAEDLAAGVPGVGRYTAGAISSIVFGQAAPMVDGNVLRVLSRQLGIFGDVKTNKIVIDTLWAAADALVKAVARDSTEGSDKDESDNSVSDRPGRWGQALMELGSTICIPKPNCAACPVSSTCRAYGEGIQLATRKGLVSGKTTAETDSKASTCDMEDICSLCDPFREFAPPDEEDNKLGSKASKNMTTPASKLSSKKQATLQAFAFAQPKKIDKKPSSSSLTLSTAAMEVVTNYARKFPVKTIKKAVREEETLVCAIRRSDGRYLIRRRPEKGLLAGLWEFPSYILPEPGKGTPKTRKRDAKQYVSSLDAGAFDGKLKHLSELGSVPWLFSHIKLTMHVHLFELDNANVEESFGSDSRSRWTDTVGEESMGTGMRKCWDLVREAASS